MTAATLSPKRATAGARRYMAWLATDRRVSFGDWLKEGEPEPDDTCSSCIGTGIGDPHTGSPCTWCRGSGVDKKPKEYDL